MDELQTFGLWVKRRRKALDMTQQELADWVGCSLSAMIKIEGGVRRPSRQIAERILEYLETPPAEQAALLQLARAAPGAGEPPSSHLPASLTSLVGRTAEIAQVRALMLGSSRLITLIGPGGIGKTRLGLAVAADVGGSFKDGVYFVPL